MKILAVSGGIDSVVMLHFLQSRMPKDELVVAHFDHGIRKNSCEDADFVKRLAEQCGVAFECEHRKLGADCSEAKAREERYGFLRKIADKYHGVICVAHHDDDVIESMAINVLRGTGWRGIAPMNSKDIERPLKGWRKRDIYHYAGEHQLHFRQDQTNNDDDYLRNRVRMRLRDATDAQATKLIEIYNRQSELLGEISAILDEIDDAKRYPRSLLDCDDEVAVEILRHILAKKQVSLTRPQFSNALKAIREYSPNKRFSIGINRFILVGRYSFEIML